MRVTLADFDQFSDNASFEEKRNLAKDVLLNRSERLKKNDLVRLCGFVNDGMKEFALHGQQVNNITYFELVSHIRTLVSYELK